MTSIAKNSNKIRKENIAVQKIYMGSELSTPNNNSSNKNQQYYQFSKENSNNNFQYKQHKNIGYN
jgi:hypothetical protein